jgi:hypothetical protein
MIKIRYKTWYWGNWVYEGEYGFTLAITGFEIYNEALHGFHHSAEYRYNKERATS